MPELFSRNLIIHRRRTSMRLERRFWDLVSDIANREAVSLSVLVERFTREFGRNGGSRASAVRTGALVYFAAAATESGHSAAGHGAAPAAHASNGDV